MRQEEADILKTSIVQIFRSSLASTRKTVMIEGAILNKGEPGYTCMKKLFRRMDNFQKNYNWLITDCEAYPKRPGHPMRITQSKYNNYAWIGGEEEAIVYRFREAFPLSEDLREHNRRA